MGTEGPHADNKTAKMAKSLDWCCSWTIMQDPALQGTQQNTFVSWDGRHWITQPTSCLMPDLVPSDIHLLSVLKLILSGVTSEAMKRCNRL
ncbi:hypothetical protein AVEN_169934-1 [Araneus ventricosus]|uniref:Uncharacterized protein n=1 Tax=Araneus ventricosus TaxID=182803 RepID=A0A4Y2N5L8_ARAVE|nr:hypothetical protein AVEN_169934-1 [Araneus ventricosus]